MRLIFRSLHDNAYPNLLDIKGELVKVFIIEKFHILRKKDTPKVFLFHPLSTIFSNDNIDPNQQIKIKLATASFLYNV